MPDFLADTAGLRSWLLTPGRDHGRSGKVETAGGHVEQVLLDLGVGGQLSRDQIVADVLDRRPLKFGAGRPSDREVGVALHLHQPAWRSSRGRVRP